MTLRYKWISITGLLFILTVLAGRRYLTTAPQGEGAVASEIADALQVCVKEQSRTAFILCVRKQIEPGVARLGMRQYMDSLAEVFSRADMDKNRCHDIAHVVGQVGALTARNGRHLISDCTATMCGDGCFHGYLEGYVSRGGSVSDAVSSLCQPIGDEDSRSRWACFHGLGHGVAGLTASDDQAFSLCDLIGDVRDRRNCGAGVLMELYQSPSSPEAARPLPKDLGAYCQNLAFEYRSVCFTVSGAIVYEHTKDEGDARDVCFRVPVGEDQKQCFMKLASVWYNESETNVEATRTLCRTLPPPASHWCILGSVEDSVLSGAFVQALEFCRGSSDEAQCFEFLGDIVAYGYGEGKRTEVCTEAPDHAKNACLSQEDRP